MKLRTAMILVGIAGFATAAVGTNVRATYGAQVSVDEPQYLITAISLWEDRSLDVSDEIAGERYVSFHELPLDRQTQPLEDGSEISPHDPLLPLYLAGPMEMGGWVGAKLSLAALNGALAALLVWTAVRRSGASVGAAVVVVGVFACSAPLAVYGNQVYPEIPAALALCVSVVALTGPLRTPGLMGLGASVIVLPWLSVKYVPVAGAIAAIALWVLVRAGRRRTALGLMGGLGAAGVLYLLAHLAWYGGLTVYGTGDHFVSTGEFAVVGTDVNLLGRSRRLIGLLVDNKFGLLLWQPAYLLVLPAIGAALRTRARTVAPLLVLIAVGWLTASFVALTMQGWWWPGRQVVIVLPAVVLLVTWWASAGPRRLALTAGLGTLGIASYAWVVVEGLNEKLTWVVDFFETSNPVYRGLSQITPDYLDVTTRTWVLHGVWIAVAAALIVWGYRTSSGGGGSYGVELELDPLVVDAEPEPELDPEPEDSEPSTSRTPDPSSPHATPVVRAAAHNKPTKIRLVPARTSTSS